MHNQILVGNCTFMQLISVLLLQICRDQPIMFIILPIMLCSGAQNFDLLYAHVQRFVLKI